MPAPAAPLALSAAADLLVIASRAVLPGGEAAAAIEIREGRITGIHNPSGPLPAATQTVHLPDDQVLLPGLVDSHVHGNEPGRTHWEGLETLSAAAAAGGITTLADMPLNCIPATVTADAVQAKRQSCPHPAVDIAMWGGAVGGRLEDIPELLAAGVWGLKAFMVDSGVVEFPALLDDDGLILAIAATAQAGVPLLVHAEDAEEAARAPQAIATNSYAALLASRPVACEVKAIERLAGLMEGIPGAHVHVVHVTSAEGVAAIAAAQSAGLQMTGESCPHYLLLHAGLLPDADPTVKCFPPIRELRHQDALWAGLLDGTLQLIASDHSPAPWPLKNTGDLSTAWGGIASIQLSLPVAWTAASRRGIPLAQLVHWMSAAPADLIGLPQKGRIEVGADADLVAFAPDAHVTVRGAELLHRHPQTPYEGRRLRGVVRQTWLRGARVDASAPHGRWLMRGATGASPGDAAAPPATSANPLGAPTA
ncbi:MAG: allantoinase AllB [Solirubrobacteraceae bacterium]|nr:allantoinase AllB [Solirubrobacteraceae bacterium]